MRVRWLGSILALKISTGTNMRANFEEYDRWRYYYPKFDTTQIWAKVPSQELSDAMVDAFKDHLQSDKKR